MSQQLDRPKRPARGPRPAADEGQDPVDYRPAHSEPAAAPAAPVEGKGAPSASAAAPSAAPATTKTPAPEFTTAPRGREQTVQLATRVSPEIAALIDAAASRTGQSKRQIIEHAIRQAWQ